VVVDGRLVLGVGNRIAIIDIADGARPAVVGEVELDGVVTDVDVLGDRVVVTTAPGGLVLLDIQVYTKPRVAEKLEAAVPGGDGIAVATGNGSIYVVETSWLRVVQLMPTDHLEVIGQLAFSPPVVSDIDYSNNALFICTEDDITVVDVSEPRQPQITTSVLSNGIRRFVGMTIEGNTAFVGAMRGGLIVLDVSSSEMPIEIASRDSDIDAHTIARYGEPFIQGTRLYIPSGTNGMRVFDVSDRSQPLLLGKVAATGDVVQVCVSGNEIMLVDTLVGLVFLREESPSDVAVLSVMEWPSPVTRAIIVGDSVFLSAGMGSLLVYDAAAKGAAPELVYRRAVAGHPFVMTRLGGLLVGAYSGEGDQVFRGMSIAGNAVAL
jgi:hypothetical protein